MAQTKDKKLKELELKVSQLANKVAGISRTAGANPQNSPAYVKAKAEYDAAVVELENYQSTKKPGLVNYGGAYSENYEGQTELDRTLGALSLDLVTQPNGGTVVANTKEIGQSGEKGYIAVDSPHFIYIGREGYVSGPTSARPFEKGAYAKGVDISRNPDEIKKKIITDFQRSPEGLNGLFQKLFDAGYISKATFNSKDISSDEFNAGLFSVVNAYGKKVISDYQYGDRTKEPIDFNTYLSSAKDGTAGPKTTYQAVVTLKQDAIVDIDRFFMDFLGRGATQAEEDEYYKLLRNLEKKNIVRRTQTEGGTTESGELVSAEDILELQRKVAGKSLTGSNLDTVIKTGAGAARSINSLIDDARQYGIILSNKEAVDLLAKDLSAGRLDEKAMKSRLVQISKANYSNLSELSDEISVKDLSRNLIMTMGEVLELDPNGIDVLDPTIQKALKNNGNKGIMSLTDFEVMLRNDARWAKTRNAKEEASRYGYEILKSFGLMA